MKGKQLVAAILLCLPGVTFFNILPVYLGAATEHFGLTPDKVGFLSAAEMGSLALASLLGPLWINRFDWRRIAFFVILVMLSGNLLTIIVNSYESLLLVRIYTGLFGEGIAFALAVAAVSESQKPDRGFALLTMAQTIVGAIGLFYLPGMISIWGISPVMLFLVLLTLIVLPFLGSMPMRSTKLHSTVSNQLVFPIYLPLIGLLSLTLFCMNIGAFWGFVERIGNHAMLEADTIGMALGLGMLAGIPGSAVAAWINDKYGRIWPFCLTLIAHGGLMFILLTPLTGVKLSLIMIAYNLVWNFGMPFLQGLISTSDSTARTAVLIPVAMSAGVGVGSAIAGILVGQYGYASISTFAAICCCLGLITFIPVAFRIVNGKSFTFTWTLSKNS